MIRVVLDTNVVISAAVSKNGNPTTIFEMLILDKIKNYTTQEIIDEITDVFQRPKITKILNLEGSRYMINTFEKFSEKITCALTFKEIKEDPDDNKFLDCAVSASADYIISGDDHLLKLR